jgi:hypothetical protein
VPSLVIACERIDAIHLVVTLASAAANPASACKLFYPYGQARTGSGHAVTDNADSVAPPSGWDGWDIGNQLGSPWNINYLLAATTYGLPISTSPT